MNAWSDMPKPVLLRKSFLEAAGFDVEPSIEDVQQLSRDGWTAPKLAEALHMNVRTVYRWIDAPTPCPGERCLTLVRGGGPCSFCRGAA